MFTSWNLYPARNVDTNVHIEKEFFNLLKPDGTVPLGICNSNIRFFKKLHQRNVRGAFLCLFVWRTTGKPVESPSAVRHVDEPFGLSSGPDGSCRVARGRKASRSNDPWRHLVPQIRFANCWT